MELMISVSIVAILAAIVLPSYENYRLKAARSAGTDCLVEAQRRLESYYSRSNTYPSSSPLQAVGFSSDPYACGDDGAYLLARAAEDAACPLAYCYQLVATAQGRQVRDGDLRLTFDARETNPNKRFVREHRPPSGTTWTPGWIFQPGQ